MPEQLIRFGVYDGGAKRAATWRCWSRTGVGKNDLYLSCREIGGALKVSLHESGQWHVAYFQEFFDKNVEDSDLIKKGRFIDRWSPPAEIAPGVTLAFGIVTPWSSVTASIDDADARRIHWIPSAPEGHALEIAIVLTRSGTSVSGWPGRQTMNTELVGSIELDSGDSVWIVYREIDMPDLSTVKGTPRYYKGRSEEDLRCGSFRVLLLGIESDGSRVLYDCVGQHESNGL
jgi:hypothetical protein